jgi:exoribonuclease R
MHDYPIVGILHTNSKYRYGFTSHNVPCYLFTPLDENIPPSVVGSKIQDRSKNYLALSDYKNVEKISTPRSNLISVLGDCYNWEAERLALIWRYNPYNYSKKIERLDYTEIKNPIFETKRLDLTGPEWTTINIDPKDCEDIDDCISYKLENPDIQIAITIADVASTILENTELDKEAAKRGFTFYSNSDKRNMLPLKIEQTVSLNPNTVRHGVSLLFRWNSYTKTISDLKFELTKIKNKKSYTYEDIYYSDESGLIGFLTQFGESPDSHKWIEKLMIFYNIEAAKLLKQNNTGIFRRHSKPNEEKIKTYFKFLPSDIKQTMIYESAEYCLQNENMSHYGLNQTTYCHITSPIRRYADLLNQRLLKKIIQKDKINFEVSQSVVDSLMLRQKAVNKFNRELFFLNLLHQNQTNTVRGTILFFDDEKKSTKVYIEDWKRIVTIKNFEYDSFRSIYLQPGDMINLKYHYNMNSVLWKNKIVYSLNLY